MDPVHPGLRHSAAVSAVLAMAVLVLPMALASAAAGATGNTGAVPSAQSEYQAALRSVGTKGVHFTSKASQGGISIHVVGDTGGTSGMQTLVVSDTKISEHLTSLVVGSTGYVLGNTVALEHVIGLTTSESSKYAGTWLSFPTSTQGVSELVGGLLNSQVSTELQMSGPYSYGKTVTLDGQQLRAVQGWASTSNGKVETVLYVPVSGTPLPAEVVTNPSHSGGSSGINGTVTFSHWGEKTSEHKPKHTISLLKLSPGSSGSGSSTTGQ